MADQAVPYKVLRSKTCGCEIWQDLVSGNLVGFRVSPECRDSPYSKALMMAYQSHVRLVAK